MNIIFYFIGVPEIKMKSQRKQSNPNIKQKCQRNNIDIPALATRYNGNDSDSDNSESDVEDNKTESKLKQKLPRNSTVNPNAR